MPRERVRRPLACSALQGRLSGWWSGRRRPRSRCRASGGGAIPVRGDPEVRGDPPGRATRLSGATCGSVVPSHSGCPLRQGVTAGGCGSAAQGRAFGAPAQHGTVSAGARSSARRTEVSAVSIRFRGRGQARSRPARRSRRGADVKHDAGSQRGQRVKRAAGSQRAAVVKPQAHSQVAAGVNP